MLTQVTVDDAEMRRQLVQWPDQVRFALTLALTRTGQAGKKKLQGEMNAFDRPTRYTKTSVYTSPADKAGLESRFGLKDQALIQKSGQLSPADVLGHHFRGGTARYRQFERALYLSGILFKNETVVPAASHGPEVNIHGNIKQSFIVQILSYFGVFQKGGFRANATVLSKKRRGRLSKTFDYSEKGTTTINGVQYFYSHGIGSSRHLHKGIWARTGYEGVDIRPVMLFVKRARYKKRIDLDGYRDFVQREFNEQLPKAFKQAVRTAR